MNTDETIIEPETSLLTQAPANHQQLLRADPSKRAPLVGTQKYHQSHTFQTKSGINALITAAAPLLAIASTLRRYDNDINLGQLHNKLCHEVHAFESLAQEHHYASEIIVVARYILSATIDELIQATTWGGDQAWQQYCLVNTFNYDNMGSDRLFSILQHLQQDPSDHIDTLELIYYCFSLGFRGHYRTIKNGEAKVRTTMAELYQTIREQRGELKNNLLITTDEVDKQTLNPKPFSFVWPLLTSLVFIACIYVSYSFMITASIEPIYTMIKDIKNHTSITT